MMKMVIDTKLVKDTPSSGVLYVLLMDLEEKQLVKVGVTGRKVEERVCEILTSVWIRYRFFPKVYVKKYTVVSDPYEKEAKMHKELEEYRYKTQHKFSGCTEMFDVDLDLVMEVYKGVCN
jgi:hypothetical protein